MNKKIITIAEIVFALVFVVLLSVFMATINSKGNTANNQLVDTLEMTDGTSIQKYESSGIVKGSDVVNAVNNYKTIGGNLKITVLVKTNSDSKSLYGYKSDGSGETWPSYNATSTDTNYINPSGNFLPTVIKNANGIVVGLAFEQDPGENPTVFSASDLT